MFRKVIVLTFILSLLLAGCGTLEISFDVTPALAENARPTPVATAEPKGTLSMKSTSDEIYAAMLTSATQWQTIWMAALNPFRHKGK